MLYCLIFRCGICLRAKNLCRLLRFTRRFRLGFRKELSFTPRKSLQTFTKDFLMHAHKSLREMYISNTKNVTSLFSIY